MVLRQYIWTLWVIRGQDSIWCLSGHVGSRTAGRRRQCNGLKIGLGFGLYINTYLSRDNVLLLVPTSGSRDVVRRIVLCVWRLATGFMKRSSEVAVSGDLKSPKPCHDEHDLHLEAITVKPRNANRKSFNAWPETRIHASLARSP